MPLNWPRISVTMRAAPEQRRRVHVVPARVHHAGRSRAIRHLIGFLNRERIRMGQRNRARCRVAALDKCDNAGFGHPYGAQTKLTQLALHVRGGLVLLERGLGMSVMPEGLDMGQRGSGARTNLVKHKRKLEAGF